jgi:hypothetical protein
LILWSVQNEQQAPLAISAAALSFIDGFSLGALSDLEHSKSLRPFSILAVYLFLSSLFDAARVRTLWLMNFNVAIWGLLTASLAMKVVILMLEVREKMRFLAVNDRDKSPDETSGIFNKGIFWWLNILIRAGFSKILQMNDLYPMDERMTASVLGSNIRYLWITCKTLVPLFLQ